jgi:predicted nuclease of predicted toxin-antitoxin system
LLVDQNLGRRTSALLRELGHEALDTRELGLPTASDSKILDVALADSRIIVTLDSDFHAMLATQGLPGPSTILLRLHVPTAREASTLIHSVCERFEQELLNGCMVTADADSVRLRRLPITFSRQIRDSVK